MIWDEITNIKHMINAKEEFLRVTHIHKVLCASVKHAGVTRMLKVNYSPEDYDKFLNEMDFEYDAGYGTQKVKGFIWMQDGTWYDRGEYDGSEWWEYRSVPNIPKELRD
jgi:hypothetical protein